MTSYLSIKITVIADFQSLCNQLHGFFILQKRHFLLIEKPKKRSKPATSLAYPTTYHDTGLASFQY
jgi:hypothetical protein